ncbi:MAG: efflux RND transporter periplasmic adaptor subunit [Rubrivivax sp.]
MKRPAHAPWRSLPAALSLALLCTLAPTGPALAGPGHDHGEPAAPAPRGDGPQRQPDGSVFLPKPAQRLLGVRTQVVALAELPRTLVLNGQVQVDPNAGGQVQAMNAGRIEPGPRGLPQLGQAVRRGEVLAYVRPALGAVDAANQAALLAGLRADQALAQQRLARLQALADTVPRKDIDSQAAELASLAARIAAVGGGLAGREALVAPVSGVVSTAQVVAGQVVDARERLFDIVDPRRLRIEALAYDPALATDIDSASLALGSQRLPLKLVGAAQSLRDQALPVAFSLQTNTPPALAVGQPVQVFVQTRQRVSGLAVPAAALMKNPANQTVVWVKTAPERFEPRAVTTVPLDGVQVAVTSGLRAGERVATQAAHLINQVR